MLDTARELGFVALGFVEFASHPEEMQTLQVWLEEKHHGSMTYMEKRVTSYGFPQTVFPRSAGAVMVLFRWSNLIGNHSAPWVPWVASFAGGRDYHGRVKQRLRQLERHLNGTVIASFVDSSPYCERGLASRAGLGWLGKNRYLIHPVFGGDVGIAEIVVRGLRGGDTPAVDNTDGCGKCHACIDACPTGALTETGLDARRCLSFLTAESRKSIPPDLRKAVGTRMFGCDECLAACPRGGLARSAPPAEKPEFPLSVLSIRSNRDFRDVFIDSPFYRLGRKATLRNAMVVLGNLREERAIDRLSDVARGEPSAMVREQALWALGRMDTRRTRMLMTLSADHAATEAERITARGALDGGMEAT